MGEGAGVPALWVRHPLSTCVGSPTGKLPEPHPFGASMEGPCHRNKSSSPRPAAGPPSRALLACTRVWAAGRPELLLPQALRKFQRL